MKNGAHFSLVELVFGATKSLVSRELQFVVPIIYCSLTPIIAMPVQPEPFLMDIIGSVDCTIHLCNSPTTGQSLLWRGDKKCHFLSTQLAYDLEGIPMRVDIGLGHNNDLNMFNSTQLGDWLIANNVKLFADSMYNHSQLVTPEKALNEAGQLLFLKQFSFRSCIETVFAQVKT